MQLLSEEVVKIFSEQPLEIEDSLKGVSLKIDAAHSGVMNGNYLFYLPQALEYGANSLNKFYKPLQKKHYSKSLGYIHKSEYIPTNTNSIYFKKITESGNKKELVKNVKEYIKTPEYKQNKTGFGVLVSKAKLYDQNKIEDLKYSDSGTVSVAGDAGIAICSICEKHIANCGHKLGQKYKNNELCFGIVVDDFEIDHISFEAIPANWETKSLIIADSQSVGTIELIKEGQLMKLTLEQLKEKLSNIDSVLAELNLTSFKEQYLKDIEETLKSKFLLASDKLLPFSTPLTIYVTKSLLDTLEESEDKVLLESLFGASYTDIFDGKTEEEINAILLEGVKEVQSTTVEPEVKKEVIEVQPSTLSVEDSNKIALAIADSLAATFDNSFNNILSQLKDFFTKQEEVKANKILTDRLNAFQEDLKSADSLNSLVTDELKQSLINQIILLKGLDKESDYVSKLKNRSVQELKMTLEDHLQLATKALVETPKVEPKVEPVIEQPTLQVKDNNQHASPVDVSTAVEDMANTVVTLEITDEDKTIAAVISSVSEKLNKAQFSSLYKKTVLEHGSKVAKKLHSALKAQNKI